MRTALGMVSVLLGISRLFRLFTRTPRHFFRDHQHQEEEGDLRRTRQFGGGRVDHSEGSQGSVQRLMGKSGSKGPGASGPAGPELTGNMAADAFIKNGIVPDIVDTAPTETAAVTYESNTTIVDFGNELTPTQVKSPPQVIWAAEEGYLYTLIMTDPDAPSRSNPKFREWHHWLIVNIPGHDIGRGEVLTDYIGAAPPKDSGLHRYVFLVYRQQGKLTCNEERLPNNSTANRGKFKTKVFATKYKLGNPVAGNFFQAQWDDWVPQLYASMKK
ncbi:protein D1-like [Branchiostoma floridae x Branchiostoma belcheri]